MTLVFCDIYNSYYENYAFLAFLVLNFLSLQGNVIQSHKIAHASIFKIEEITRHPQYFNIPIVKDKEMCIQCF